MPREILFIALNWGRSIQTMSQKYCQKSWPTEEEIDLLATNAGQRFGDYIFDCSNSSISLLW